MSSSTIIKQKKTPDEIATSFQNNVVRLIDNLVTVLPPTEQVVLEIVKWNLTERYDKHHIITKFIKHSSQFWNEIETDNEEFFLNDQHANKIFGDLPVDKVLNFKRYWIGDENLNPLTDDDKIVIKQYFKSFVKQARNYDLQVNKKKND